MILKSIYLNTALRRFHSTDLADMRQAILDDEDGGDRGNPPVRDRTPPFGGGATEIGATRRRPTGGASAT
jgi:hypothetical protein